jgi:hypothetical protein
MVEVGLTWEEQKRLDKVRAAVFFGFFLAFVAYFIYCKEYTDTLKTTWDILVRLGVPFVVGGSLASFLTFEVLYRRKVKKSIAFHVRRLGNNVLFVLAFYLLYLLIVGTSITVFSETLSELYTVTLGTALWLLTLNIVAFKRRQQRMRRILT